MNMQMKDTVCIWVFKTESLGNKFMDSTMDWSMTWWIDDYNITIEKDSCNYEGIKMINVGNMGNDLITGKVIGDSLIIPSQFSSGYEIFETNGYFLNDSFFVQIMYLTPNFGDAYLKILEGKNNRYFKLKLNPTFVPFVCGMTKTLFLLFRSIFIRCVLQYIPWLTIQNFTNRF